MTSYTIFEALHGTNQTEAFRAFDPATSGIGTDELGSGYYFTDSPDTAYMYSRMVKEGKERANPFIYSATLNFERPIFCSAYEDTRHPLTVEASIDQVARILMMAPDLTHEHRSPLFNWIPTIPSSKGQLSRQVNALAVNYAGDMILNNVENDWFPRHSQVFRHAIRAVLKWDGVICSYGERNTFVAWSPEQIEIKEIKDGHGNSIYRTS